MAGENRKDKKREELRWLCDRTVTGVFIWQRDNFTCQICGARKFLSIDHIIPENKGGKLTENNLQTLCKKCNSKKGVR